MPILYTVVLDLLQFIHKNTELYIAFSPEIHKSTFFQKLNTESSN